MRKSIQCWQCGTRMTLDALASNDGDCPECEVEIHLGEYFSEALDTNQRLEAELAALKAKAEVPFAYHKKYMGGTDFMLHEPWCEDGISPEWEPLYAAAPAQPQEVVLATDYAALEAECKRLLDLLADWSSHFTGPKVIGGPLSSLRERTDAALLGGST